jgi:glycosyltransferase involved in cell wall biosynthesis
MRITFLLTQGLESPSGLGRYWPLAKELARLGHAVTVLALHPDFGALEERRFAREGVRVHYVAQMHVLKRASTKRYFGPMRLLWVITWATWRLTWCALRTPSDVYHLGKPHPMNGVAGLVLHFLGRQVYLDCDDYEAVSNRFSGAWQRRIVAWFEDRLPGIAAGVTVNTRFVARRLEALGVPTDRILYVPNGVDRARFARFERPTPGSAEADRLRRDLDLEGRRVVCYVGSMSLASHPVDLLLEALEIVRRVVPDVVLLLVGGGEDLATLQARARELELGDAVRFVGRVSPDRVPAYYGLAEVSIDPVRDDWVARARSPLKLFESLAVGTPVVTGDVGDRRASLEHAGLLVKPGSASALGQAIAHVLQHPDEVQSMRDAAASLQSRYYWDVLVHEFEQVYGEMGWTGEAA